MLDLRPQTLTGAAVTWLLPLLVSFGLFDPGTGAYYPSYAGFKVIMALLAAICAWLTYRWIAQRGGLTLGVPVTYLLLNSLLDLAVLVAGFGMPLTVWVSTVFPVYAVIFFALYFVMRMPR